MCVAGRLPGVLLVCVCSTLANFFNKQLAAVLSYDRDQLLLIKSTVNDAQIIDNLGTHHCPSPILANIPSDLWRIRSFTEKESPKKDAVEASLLNLKKLFEVHRRSIQQMATLRQALP